MKLIPTQMTHMQYIERTMSMRVFDKSKVIKGDGDMDIFRTRFIIDLVHVGYGYKHGDGSFNEMGVGSYEYYEYYEHKTNTRH